MKKFIDENFKTGNLLVIKAEWLSPQEIKTISSSSRGNLNCIGTEHSASFVPMPSCPEKLLPNAKTLPPSEIKCRRKIIFKNFSYKENKWDASYQLMPEYDFLHI